MRTRDNVPAHFAGNRKRAARETREKARKTHKMKKVGTTDDAQLLVVADEIGPLICFSRSFRVFRGRTELLAEVRLNVLFIP